MKEDFPMILRVCLAIICTIVAYLQFDFLYQGRIFWSCVLGFVAFIISFMLPSNPDYID